MTPLALLSAILALASGAPDADAAGTHALCRYDGAFEGEGPATVRLPGAPFIYVAKSFSPSDMAAFEAWRKDSLAQVRAAARRLGLTLSPSPALVVMDFMAPTTPDGEIAPSYFSGYAIKVDSGEPNPDDGPVTMEYLPAADALALPVDGGEASMIAAQEALARAASERGRRAGPYLIVAYGPGGGEATPVAVCRTLAP